VDWCQCSREVTRDLQNGTESPRLNSMNFRSFNSLSPATISKRIPFPDQATRMEDSTFQRLHNPRNREDNGFSGSFSFIHAEGKRPAFADSNLTGLLPHPVRHQFCLNCGCWITLPGRPQHLRRIVLAVNSGSKLSVCRGSALDGLSVRKGVASSLLPVSRDWRLILRSRFDFILSRDGPGGPLTVQNGRALTESHEFKTFPIQTLDVIALFVSLRSRSKSEVRCQIRSKSSSLR
jgi:hypothetical protein